MAGEGFQLVQRLALLEGFGIQLDGRERGVAAGAAAGGFLGMLRMGCRVGSENFGLPLVAASSRASWCRLRLSTGRQNRCGRIPPTSMWLRL